MRVGQMLIGGLGVMLAWGLTLAAVQQPHQALTAGVTPLPFAVVELFTSEG